MCWQWTHYKEGTGLSTKHEKFSGNSPWKFQNLLFLFFRWHSSFFLRKLSIYGLPWWRMLKHPPANAGDSGSIPGSGRSPGNGDGNPFQSSCLNNPINREACWTTVHGVPRIGHKWARRHTALHLFLGGTARLFGSSMLPSVKLSLGFRLIDYDTQPPNRAELLWQARPLWQCTLDFCVHGPRWEGHKCSSWL